MANWDMTTDLNYYRLKKLSLGGHPRLAEWTQLGNPHKPPASDGGHRTKATKTLHFSPEISNTGAFKAY